MIKTILAVMLMAGTAWANPHPHDREGGSGGTNTSPPTVTTTVSDTTSLRVEGDDRPVSSAASLNMGACKAGGSGQGGGFGFAIGVSESMCLVLAAAYAATNACVTMPTIPVPCGGGSELPPIPDLEPGFVGAVILMADDDDSEPIPMLYADDPIDVYPYLIDPHPIECHQVNPVCDMVPWYWEQVENETRAVVGFMGWRWRLKQFLPWIIAWPF